MHNRSDDDLLAPEWIRDPYPFLADRRARAEVLWNERFSAWMVLSYAGVAEGLRSRSLSSARVPQPDGTRDVNPRLAAALETLARWLVFKDPPDHTRLRRLVLKSFTSQAVGRISARIQRITQDLLDECPSEVEFDIVQRIAYPLPAIVIAELLGVPPDDRDVFRTWSDQISELVFGGGSTSTDRSRSADAMLSFVEYFSDLIAFFERNPADNLISSLIAARDKDDALTRSEIIAMAVLILFAGHETTTNLISTGLYHLIRTPEQRRRLVQNPGLIEPAVEELLRFDGPSKIAVRHAAEPVTIAGCQMDAGARVFLVQASANRDPAMFHDPDGLDIERTPNLHLGFGHGIHFCLGAPLARFEAQAAILAVLQRFPRLDLVRDELDWEPVLLNRGPTSLWVSA